MQVKAKIKNALKGNPFLSRRILALTGILVLCALVAAGYWFFFMRGIVYSDDARIDADVVDLAPEINGTLRQVLVTEGMTVKKGQVLFVLDTESLEADVTQAQAELNATKSNLSVQEAACLKAVHGPRKQDIKIAYADVMRLHALNKLADIQLARIKRLYSKNATSQSALENAQAAYDSGKQSLEEATQKLNLLLDGTRSEDIKAAKCRVDLARGEVKKAAACLIEAKTELDKATVRAPCDGVVVRRWEDPGSMLPAGTPVLSVLDTASLRVAANIEEKYLYRVAPGDQVDIAVDAFPELRLKGHIERILRATNSEFSLIPPEGVSGTFIKVAQRVRLRISIDTPHGHLPLGPGMSVEVYIHTTQGWLKHSLEKKI